MLTLSNGSQIDEATLSGSAQPDAGVSGLMKVIKGLEGGDYNNRSGDSGSSAGAYQWNNDNKPLKPGELPSHWKNAAGQYLKDANAPMTPENQNYVAYQQIKAYKDQGRTPMEIDALWNGAHEDSSGQYVHNSDARAQAFLKASNEQQPQGNGYVQAPPPRMPEAPDASTSTDSDPGKGEGFLQGLQEDLSGTNPESLGTQMGNTIKGVADFVAPSIGDAYNLATGKNKKTGLQLAGDLGSTALSAATLIPGVGEIAAPLKVGLMGAKAVEAGTEVVNLASKAAPGLLKGIGKNAALGGAYGATQGLGAGDTDPTKITEDAGTGALTGGLLGGTGELVLKAASVLPQRLVQGAIKTSNPDVAKYALTKSLGSPAKMLEDSNASLKTIGSQLGDALTHANVADVVVPSEQIVPKIMEAFPNAELSPEKLEQEIGKVAPLQKRLITKLFSGEGLTIDELHTLNSAIGQNTYKMAFDDPTVKAGKAIGNAFYQASKDIITKIAPDTAPLFDQYSKEIQLNTALDKAVKRGSKTQALTLRDIMSLIGGFSALGPVGAFGALAAERLATSPTVNLKAAGLLNKASGKAIRKAVPAITLGATGAVRGLMNPH